MNTKIMSFIIFLARKISTLLNHNKWVSLKRVARNNQLSVLIYVSINGTNITTKIEDESIMTIASLTLRQVNLLTFFCFKCLLPYRLYVTLIGVWTIESINLPRHCGEATPGDDFASVDGT